MPASLSHSIPLRANRQAAIRVPAALAYAAASALHRRLYLRSALRVRGHLRPLLVIGGLRAGGSGKTAVALELARRLALSGKTVALIAYRLRTSADDGVIPLSCGLAEIEPAADWRACSDEAVLLARSGVGRVFVTRNREQAWDVLSRLGGFDVLISDDGFCDPRLTGSLRLLLRAPGETPRRRDLLPAGPYRLTAKALRCADGVLTGPLSDRDDETASAGLWFRRSLEFPPGFDRHRSWWAVCGIGNPGVFRRDLTEAGVRLTGMSIGPDHALPPPRRFLQAARLHPEAGFLCTAKDAVKLSAAQRDRFAVIGERITLGPRVMAIVEDYLQRFSSW